MIRKAVPVWTGKAGVNQYVEARQRFRLEETGPARLQICAETEYAVWLNGHFAGSGQYRTGRGVTAYDEYDVTQWLRTGENECRITASSEGEDSQTYQRDTPMLAFALTCGSAAVLSGPDTEIRVHPHYQSGRLEKVTPQLGYACRYDASAPETPWQKAVPAAGPLSLIPRPVKKLAAGDLVTGRLLTQGALQRTGDGTPAELMQRDGLFFRRREEIFDGDTVRQRPEGVYLVIDLGAEYAGWLTMELEAAAGTVLDIGWGEHLEDLRVRTAVGNRHFACRYVCREGRQEHTEYFRRFGCRYLQIHITHMAGDVRFRRLGLIPTDYPLTREGYFHCSDFFLNRLCRMAARTLKLCMHEHYEDCPWREQALYAFDSYIQMLCGYYLFGEYDFARASLQLLADGRKENGLLRICAPSGIGQTIPSFSLAWILSLEQYVLYSGDTAFGRRMLPVAEGILGAFRLENGLVQNDPAPENWHFYEWTPGLDGEGGGGKEDCAAQCLYILAVEACRRLLDHTGAPENRKGPEPEALRAAAREKYYDPQTGFFRTRAGEDRFHALTQALACLSGVSADPRLPERLLRKDNGLLPVTLAASLFQYEALLAAGEKYADAVLEEIAEIWGGMVFSASDTLWEVAEGASAFDDAGSLCHGWSAVPVYLLYKYYLGFAPTAPGFREYRLQPLSHPHLAEIRTVLFTPEGEREISVSGGNGKILCQNGNRRFKALATLPQRVYTEAEN